MLKVIDATLDYQKDVQKLLQRVLDQLRRSKRTILLHGIQWISITTVCFLSIYGIGMLALYTLTPYRTRPAHSDLQADYGKWAVVFIPRVDPEIIEEIKRDKPQNPEVFMNPEEFDPYEDPFIIIQGQPGNEQLPRMESAQPTTVAFDPTNTRSPDLSPTSTPIVTKTPSSSIAPTPTNSPSNNSTATLSPTNTLAPPTPTPLPTDTLVPPTPTLPPTNTPAPPAPTLPPTSTSAPPTPTLSPTNTPTPPTPTLSPTNTSAPPTSIPPPPPTNQPWVTICHMRWFWWLPPKTIQVPQDEVASHLAHGDYIGECTNP